MRKKTLSYAFNISRNFISVDELPVPRGFQEIIEQGKRVDKTVLVFTGTKKAVLGWGRLTESVLYLSVQVTLCSTGYWCELISYRNLLAMFLCLLCTVKSPPKNGDLIN